MSTYFIEDLKGQNYLQYLRALHVRMMPRTYLEIGSRSGDSLALANCVSIAIDPTFIISNNVIGQKPACLFFQCGSDDFFGDFNPTKILDSKIDFAFLDGLHLFEFLLRDFINTEQHCHANSIIAMHDCVPTDVYIADRNDDPVHRDQVGSKRHWWTGDVWKLAPILRRWRPDVSLTALDCEPTGLLLASNLDPKSTVLKDHYEEILAEFMDIDLEHYGLLRFHAELRVQKAETAELPVAPWQTPGRKSRILPPRGGPRRSQISQVWHLANLNPIHEMESPGFYATYPRLIGRSTMPEDVFTLSDHRWRQDWVPAAPVRFYLLKNVFVAADGLVFDASAKLYTETRKAHGDDDVLAAQEAITAVGATIAETKYYSRAVLCKQSGSGNYGHWLTEMLPKAYFARKELGLQDCLYAIPSATGQLADVVRESLEMIGIASENHLPLDRTPCFFRELIVVEGLTIHSVYMSPLVFDCLQHVATDIGGRGIDRVYLRRRPAKSRDFEDEERIAEYLAGQGFQIAEPSTLSFREQIATVKDARVVLGTMGAAMTNAGFCRPGSEICVFGPASAREFFYWFLCNLKQLIYYEIRCPESGPALGPLPWDRQITFSTQEMAEFLGRLRKM